MAYYTRKKGPELWRPAKFKEYSFCLCCKSEVAPGESGWESIKGRRDIQTQKMIRSSLCALCLEEWKENFNLGLCELKRFRL